MSAFLSKIKSKIGKDKDFKEIAKGGSTAFIVNLVGLGLGYLFVILVSRIYKESTAEIYGQYVIVTLLIRIGSILCRFGTDTTMLQLTAAFSTKKLWGNILNVNRSLIKIILVLGIVVTLITLIFCNQLGILLKLPAQLVFISGFFIIPMALGLYYSQSLRGLKKIGISTFLRSSALPIINFILLPVFLIFINKSAAGYKSIPIYSFWASIVITMIVGVIYWRKQVPNLSSGELIYEQEYHKTMRKLFDQSYPLLLAESMIFIGTWIDQLLLGVLGNNADVGIYNVCLKYSMVASLSLQAVNTISAPKFAEYYFKDDFNGLKANVQKTTKTIFWTTIPIVLIYFAFPKFLLSIFGNSFVSGWQAFIILTIGALVNVMTGSVGTLLQMTGKQKTMQNILLVTIFIEAILNITLIPVLGVTGAAIACTVCSCIQNFAMVYYVKKYFGFNTLGKLI